MITYLKKGKSDAAVAEADAKVQGIVEEILVDIEKRGDVAVRELSEKFDGYAPERFQLSDDEIRAAMSKVPSRAAVVLRCRLLVWSHIKRYADRSAASPASS